MVYESRLFRYGILSQAAEVTMQRKGVQKGKAAAHEADTPAPASKGGASGRTPGDKAVSAGVGAPSSSKAPAHVPRMSVTGQEERSPGARAEEPRRSSSPLGKGGAPALVPIIEARVPNEAEHRHFPRARLATRFEIWREEGGRRTFSASLVSQNVSVSGAFLESSFFLPVGTALQVRFSLDEGAEPVQARAEIVREERSGGRTGFGIRFVEFSGQTEVSLARLFFGMRLRTFAEEYLQSRRARSLPNELERVVDVLAAWELLKATSPSDPFQEQ
jgi:hypothetical protein